MVRARSNAICYQPHAAALESQFAEGQARGSLRAAGSCCPALLSAARLWALLKLSRCCRAAADSCETPESKSYIIKLRFLSGKELTSKQFWHSLLAKSPNLSRGQVLSSLGIKKRAWCRFAPCAAAITQSSFSPLPASAPQAMGALQEDEQAWPAVFSLGSHKASSPWYPQTLLAHGFPMLGAAWRYYYPTG